MTTTCYIVAYPHPSLPYQKVALPFKRDEEFDGETLLDQLGVRYKDHRIDSKEATLWMARH